MLATALEVEGQAVMPVLAIVHTSTATVEPLRALANELLPGCKLLNFVDDSILPQLAATNGDLTNVSERVGQYMRFAEQAGADVVLEACSSIGELVAPARAALGIPVVRIDEAMAAEAVQRGRTLGVAATLATTLEPTKRLLLEQAALAGRSVELRPALASEAYQRLMAGDHEGHDAALAAVLLELAPQVDCVVLAQASMARVLPLLPADQQEKFLTSPRLALAQVRDRLTHML
jgi:Asp/Glu/hydantoin racemase